MLFTSDEIDEMKLEARKTLEWTQFLSSNEIDPLHHDKPYYMVPSDDLADDAFDVIPDARRQSDKIGLRQLALSGNNPTPRKKAS